MGPVVGSRGSTSIRHRGEWLRKQVDLCVSSGCGERLETAPGRGHDEDGRWALKTGEEISHLESSERMGQDRVLGQARYHFEVECLCAFTYAVPPP